MAKYCGAPTHTCAPQDQISVPAPSTPERTERSSAVRTYACDDEEEGASLECLEVLGAFDPMDDPMDVDVLAWSEAESEEELTVEMEDAYEFPDPEEITSQCMVRPADSASHHATCPSGGAPSSPPPPYAPPLLRLNDILEEQLYSREHTASSPSPSHPTASLSSSEPTTSPSPAQPTTSQSTSSSNPSYTLPFSQRRRQLRNSGLDCLVRSDSVASDYRRHTMPVARDLKRRADSFIEGEDEDSPIQKRGRREETESGAWVTTAVVEDEAESAPAVEEEVEDETEVVTEDEVEVEAGDAVEVEEMDETEDVMEDETEAMDETEDETEAMDETADVTADETEVEAGDEAEDKAMDETEAMDVEVVEVFEVVEVDAIEVDVAEVVGEPYRASELLDGSGHDDMEDRYKCMMEITTVAATMTTMVMA